MNRSKIEWCDHTWNPITGCRHGCQYCYARRMASRFAGDVRLNLMARKDYSVEPAADGGECLYVLDAPMLNETGKPLAYPFGFASTLHKYRMEMPGKLKMGCNIFVGAMSDVFGAWVPDGWIGQVMDACGRYPIHNYLFLTKNPDRYIGLESKGELPEKKNMWYGMSVTCERDTYTAEAVMAELPAGAGAYLSIEPLLEDVVTDALEIVIANFVDWVIIGAETGNRKGKVIPRTEWVRKIVEECDEANIPVFMKGSLVPIVGEENMRRDFPEQLLNHDASPKMKRKLYGVCAGCKAHLKKSDMVALLARSKRGEQPKQYGFMCKDCFRRSCEGLGLGIPELAGLAGSAMAGTGGADG